MNGPTAGFHFRERMAGWVSTTATSSAEAGAHQAEADRQWAEVVLDVDYDDLEQVLDQRDTAAQLSGTALIAGLSPVVMQVRCGDLRLFVQDVTHVQRWTMEYRLDLRSQEGRVFELHGVKHLDRGLPHVAWPRTSTLFTTVTDESGTTVAAGILRLTVPDFLRQLTTMRVTNTDDLATKITGAPRFFGMFSAMLVRQFGGLLSEFWAFPPRPALPEPRGRPKGVAPTWWCTGHGDALEWNTNGPTDDAWLRLTRHCRDDADRGPVLLAPGFGMSTAAYVTDTIDKNLTEYLLENGFDVWLFDYRASPDLKSARTRFTIDDVAREDWPTAIAKVFDETGSRVQVFAHCVGSMSFQMAMLWDDNATMRKQVQSAVCSQVTVHPRSTWFNTFKVRIGLGPILEKMSPILAPEEERTLWNVIYDVVLRIAPTPRGEGCGNAVCQWITAYFGLTHRHWQLDDDTHNDLGRLFGVSGVYPLRHIGNMVAAGKSLDHHGKDVYVKSDDIDEPGNAPNLRIPILFLAGRHNKIFFPETSKRTYEWLRASNPDIYYERKVLPEYAHLDGIIGRDAARDVFPCIVEHLEATSRPRLIRSGTRIDVS
jgi:cholesterol oxidase